MRQLFILAFTGLFGNILLLVGHLLLPLQVVLGEVAALAEAVGIVRPGLVLARVGHATFAFPMIAVVTHIFGVVLLVEVGAQEVLLHVSVARLLAEHRVQLPLLEVADRVLRELIVVGGSSFTVMSGHLLTAVDAV